MALKSWNHVSLRIRRQFDRDCQIVIGRALSNVFGVRRLRGGYGTRVLPPRHDRRTFFYFLLELTVAVRVTRSPPFNLRFVTRFSAVPAPSRPPPNRFAAFYRARIDRSVTPFGLAPIAVDYRVRVVRPIRTHLRRMRRAVLSIDLDSHHARVIIIIYISFFITIFLKRLYLVNLLIEFKF